ncbi:hypothetical protein BMUNKI379_29270 [Burkholderia multivorans]|uniref:FAD/NAD(P)-binding protein n=1 Tax=Burkholderia multivorans TaxID=87883 RepID=UPI0006C81D1B|nr:FAD/NAD(P)-binding protein [Burkholderia multivorans]KPJ31310.1 hypothetical protein BMUNKI379_29270 [Burkholderia multivorans]PRE18145.1 hydroxyacylglutathione hydrolase [Burkholderia multivorans]
MRTVVIVGAGFCGTTLAARLLRSPPVTPLQVVLIDRSASMGRGVAYGKCTSRHLLNVPAMRMSAWPDDDAHFYRYACGRDPGVTPGSFLPRALYGDYLEDLLDGAVGQAPVGCLFRSVVSDVVRIERCADVARVVMRDGATIDADRVVLCVGNHPPPHPSTATGRDGLHLHPRYVRDPWAPHAMERIPMDKPVLLIGTGLTMLDVMLELRALGHRGQICAVSRRGLLPQGHREPEMPSRYDSTRLIEGMLTCPSTRRYLRSVLRAVDRHTRAGGDWRDVINGLRMATPTLWRALPFDERRRFMRHLRPYWEGHRHRCAPRVYAHMRDALDRGTLRIFAGKLLGHTDTADGVRVSIGLRGGSSTTELAVGTVVNCTGPAAGAQVLDASLLASLRDDGQLTCDALDLGFAINDDYALLDGGGAGSNRLYYVGPFLRAQFWEATAVPELRVHVECLAQVLCRSLADIDSMAVASA